MRTKKILLVDDDYKNSMFLKHFLEEEFSEVIYAENGQAAWEIFPSLKPDLILLDVNMPIMNGFELAQKIRACNKNVIIFFLTDRTEKSDRLKGFSLKGNDYIPKPFYPEELIAKINERFENLENQEQKPTVYKFGNTIFDTSLCTLECAGVVHKLSLRQVDILTILAQNLNSAVERDFILEKVWGYSNYPNSLALNVQISYLRRMFNADKSVTVEALTKKGYVLKITDL